MVWGTLDEQCEDSFDFFFLFVLSCSAVYKFHTGPVFFPDDITVGLASEQAFLEPNTGSVQP